MKNTLIIAFFASLAFAGVSAAAEGEYYEGIGGASSQRAANAPAIKHDRTVFYSAQEKGAVAANAGSGDYYEGVTRPN